MTGADARDYDGVFSDCETEMSLQPSRPSGWASNGVGLALILLYQATSTRAGRGF